MEAAFPNPCGFAFNFRRLVRSWIGPMWNARAARVRPTSVPASSSTLVPCSDLSHGRSSLLLVSLPNHPAALEGPPPMLSNLRLPSLAARLNFTRTARSIGTGPTPIPALRPSIRWGHSLPKSLHTPPKRSRTRRLVRGTSIFALGVGGVAIADDQFNASALTRNARTFWTVCRLTSREWMH